MGSKSIRSLRNSLDPSPSLPERFGSGISNTHDEIVPFTFGVPHKKKQRHCIGTSETSLDLEDACIVCEVSDNCVSRCCGVDCPVSFHQECLDGSEDLENSFCPYCWFKIVAVKSKALRDKAIEAEKAVYKYLDKEIESKDEVMESDGEQEHSVESTDVELQGEKATPLSEEKQVQVDKDSDKSPLTDQPEGDKEKLEVGTGKSREDMIEDEVSEASEDEERVATENIEDYEDTEIAEDQMKVNKGPEEKRDVSRVLSMQKSFSRKEDDQVKQNENQRRSRRRRLVLSDTDSEEVGTDKSGENMKEDEVNEASEDEEMVATAENIEDDEDDKTPEVQTKVAGKKREVSPVLSMQESFSGKEHGQVQQNEKQGSRRRLILNATDSEFSSTKERNGEEDVTKETSSSTKVANKSKPVAREISFFNKDQRRRLLWTPEEEEMLKVGVERFAAEANKNMPWRKILEMGENVFHETRTPADLKDKWRNMLRLGKLEH
ncbi:hypothetical protein AALP_AA6G331300 [Arabis alpina]|uniref:Uncharacterized protein n=1 Tax=Arabis alpina TaxID=50452 RepID=A0A087GT99_ARAAL|nr:hypothetical protein AALP_AA6G331300 [Arabis alpina]